MKNIGKILTLAFSLVLFTQAFAQDAAGLSLKDNMKQSGILIKQIAATLNDASKNEQNAAAVSKLIGYFESAKNQTPDSLENGSFEDYQNLIEQQIVSFKELQAALLANDNAAALAILQQINTVKKEGHDRYK